VTETLTHSNSVSWNTAKAKAKAARAAVPPPATREWVAMQPERWQMLVNTFAVNENTCGGIVEKTLADIVKTANARGCAISLSTVKRYLPDLYRYRVVTREHRWHPDSTEASPMSAPSTWVFGIRNVMPDVIIPPMPDEDDPLYSQKVDVRNDAWLRQVGAMAGVNRMRMRLVAQGSVAPF
jgi:hypothetical protein